MYFIDLLVTPADLPLHRDALPMNPSAKMRERGVFFSSSSLSRPNAYSSPRGCVGRESVDSGGGVVSRLQATHSKTAANHPKPVGGG